MSSIKYRRLDKNWDVTFGNGLGNYLTGVDAVAQAIRSRLLMFLEEWWMNKKDGLPVWQFILGVPGANNKLVKDVIDRLIVERIRGTALGNLQLVSKISDMESTYDPDARKYDFTARVDTIFGHVVVSTVPFTPGVGG